MKANFVGEEILLNVYDNSKWDNVVPCAGVITEVTEDYLKYKPYTLEETVKKLTIKKKSILQGVREEHLNVKYWNKNNLQEEKTLKRNLKATRLLEVHILMFERKKIIIKNLTFVRLTIITMD